MNSDYVGPIANSQRVGPMNFIGLRDTDYGNGLRMPTISELLRLVHASFKNEECETAKQVIETLKNYCLMGNTGVLYTSDGMFVQDNPDVQGRIFMEQKTLISKLGSHEENGVVFSDDGLVRFTPCEFKVRILNHSELAKNSGVIALTGSLENAEKTAEVSILYKSNPFFWALGKVDSPEIRIAGLDSRRFGRSLCVVANYFVNKGGRYSFGVTDADNPVLH